MVEQTGVTPAIIAYITEAFAESKAGHLGAVP